MIALYWTAESVLDACESAALTSAFTCQAKSFFGDTLEGVERGAKTATTHGEYTCRPP